MVIIIPWWAVLLIYSITFIIVAFLFQAIDWARVLREEYRNFNMGLLIYFVATLCATFMMGTLFLIITQVISQI